MKYNRLMATALLALACTAVSAQDYEYEFYPHWNIQLQGGAQYTLGEKDFGELISPNAQLGVGYQFTPVLGARLSVNAWQSKAGSLINKSSLINNQSDNIVMDYNWSWKYVAPSLDATVNLSNWFMGFNPERKWNFGAFVGLGANIAFGNDEAKEASDAMIASYTGISSNDQFLRYLWEDSRVGINARFGANVDYSINEKLAIGLELQANTTSDKYNSKKAGNPDWYFNALLGLKINLGKTSSKTPVQQAATDRPVQTDCGETIVEKIVEKEVPVQVIVPAPLRLDVYFNISATQYNMVEAQKVNQIAEYLKKYPSTKVTISGYADKGTGNASINQKLSDQRAEKVAKVLMDDYGIESSRISYKGYGDTEQPYGTGNDAALNRVAICIAE